MIKPSSKIFLTLIAVVALLASSCGGGKGSLEKATKAACRDGKITSDEWNQLVSMAENDKDFQEDGKFSESKLRGYVKDVAENKMRGIGDLAFDVTFMQGLSSPTLDLSKPIKVKFYLERSGSMVSYDTQKGNGDFKKAITTLLNSLPDPLRKEDEMMFVVNDAVYPYEKSFKEFIVSKDIFSDSKGIGDPRYTDFTCIFDSLLTRTQADELSIFVSDLLYSTKDMENTNPAKIMNEAQALTTTIFRGHKGLDVTVIKLDGDYHGKYYPFNSPNAGIEYSGSRPYYIMLVGSPEIMNRILTDPKYSNFAKFDKLEGFENYYCFSNASIQPTYSILLSHEKNRGRMKAEKTGNTRVHGLKSFDKDKEGERTMVVALNLSGILAPEKYIEDVDNYQVSSLSGFEVEEIIPLDVHTLTDKIKHYEPNATHLMVLSSDEPLKKETMTISLKNQLPEWVKRSSSTDDTNIHGDGFENTTFAFNEMMQGIYDSFFNNIEDPNYFTISLSVNN